MQQREEATTTKRKKLLQQEEKANATKEMKLLQDQRNVFHIICCHVA
jgi:hypothetical protein